MAVSIHTHALFHETDLSHEHAILSFWNFLISLILSFDRTYLNNICGFFSSFEKTIFRIFRPGNI